MANTYVISPPISNPDGSITFSGSVTLQGTAVPQPVSVTLNASGIQQVLAQPSVIALRQVVAQLFLAALAPPAVPVAPPLPIQLTVLSGTVVQ